MKPVGKNRKFALIFACLAALFLLVAAAFGTGVIYARREMEREALRRSQWEASAVRSYYLLRLDAFLAAQAALALGAAAFRVGARRPRRSLRRLLPPVPGWILRVSLLLLFAALTLLAVQRRGRLSPENEALCAAEKAFGKSRNAAVAAGELCALFWAELLLDRKRKKLPQTPPAKGDASGD